MQEEGKNRLLKNIAPILVVLFFVLIFLGGMFFERTRKVGGNDDSSSKSAAIPTLPSSLTKKLTSVEASNIEPITDKDHIRGVKNPKVFIIEYSDLECPFCKDFQATLKKLTSDYGDKVSWTYRHFPIDMLHSKARSEAEAAECAAKIGGNDAFWNYIDNVYSITPSNNGLDPKELINIAKQLNLDMSKFNTCVSNRETKDIVEADYQSGVSAGIGGTPQGFVMNVKGEAWTLQGAYSYDNLKLIVDQALNN